VTSRWPAVASASGVLVAFAVLLPVLWFRPTEDSNEPLLRRICAASSPTFHSIQSTASMSYFPGTSQYS
jgi:hypothetical protein